MTQCASWIFSLILVLSFTACSEKNPLPNTAETKQIDFVFEVPNIELNKDQLVYNPKKSSWTLHGQLYSGYAVRYYDNKKTKERFGIFNGKKEGLAQEFYSNGSYQRVSNYKSGKLHGTKKSWANDSSHTLLSHFNYSSGKPHGEQLKWYPSGELFKKMHLNKGKEEGLQQAFRENGDLYANYEAKGGRIFGMKKASLCFSLKKQSVQFKKPDEIL